jgi:hypothetical protein
MFTAAIHKNSSYPEPIESTPYPISPRSILMKSSRLRLSLPSGLFPTKTYSFTVTYLSSKKGSKMGKLQSTDTLGYQKLSVRRTVYIHRDLALCTANRSVNAMYFRID